MAVEARGNAALVAMTILYLVFAASVLVFTVNCVLLWWVRK